MYFDYKFRDEALNKCILLDGKRYSDTGMMWSGLSNITGIDIDTLSMYDDWYILDDEFYYFKTGLIFEELFMSELARECNVKCVSFSVAEDTVSYKRPLFGVISKLYRKNDKEYFYYSDFCIKYFDGYVQYLDKFKVISEGVFGNEKTNILMNDIYGMISFDMFTAQSDRGEHNFMFECDSDSIRLAPLCDNELVFKDGFNYDSPFGNYCLFETDMYTTYRRDLLEILRNERMLYDRFEHILDIDVKEVLKKTLDKYKIVMNFSNRRRVLEYLDCKKRAIDGTLRLSRR